MDACFSFRVVDGGGNRDGKVRRKEGGKPRGMRENEKNKKQKTKKASPFGRRESRAEQPAEHGARRRNLLVRVLFYVRDMKVREIPTAFLCRGGAPPALCVCPKENDKRQDVFFFFF